MRELVPLLGVNFIGTLGLSIVLPFLVVIVTALGGNGVLYGAIAATYPLFQLLAAPALGRWSDLHGRKRVLLISQIGTLLAWVVFLAALVLPRTVLADAETSWLGSFTLTVPLLLVFLARALDGATGGNVSVANAYLADLSTDANRSRNFGLLSMSSNLGFILGPALAGVLGATVLGEILPVSAALLISLIGVFVIIGLLPNRPAALVSGDVAAVGASNEAEEAGEASGVLQGHCPQAASTSVDDTECSSVHRVIEERNNRTLRALLRFPKVALFLLLYFLLYLGFNIFYAAFPVHAIGGLGWSTIELGTFFSVLSVAMLLVQGPGLRFASRFLSEGVLVVGGSVLLAVNFLLLSFGGTALAYAAALLFALGNGLMWPSFLSLLAATVDSSHQGEVQGYGASAGSLASIIGLLVGGILYESIGAAAFVIAFGFVMLVAALSLRLRGPRPSAYAPVTA